MKYLPKKVQTILEKHGFVHRNDWEVDKQGNGCFVELNQDTPAGEDWWVTIWFDDTTNGFIQAVKDYYISFDIDEEAEIFIGCRGKNGVPSSIMTIIHDQEWKEKTLEQLSDALLELLEKEDEQ